MNTKLKKITVLFGIVWIVNTSITGCGSSPGSDVKTEETQEEDVSQGDPGGAPSADTESTAEAPQEQNGEKWKVFEPDLAAAVDADFMGKVWKMDEDSFFIVEKKVKLLEDGSIESSTPSSNADIPDSQLIHVVFDDNTHFYIRTIQGNGESHEDKDAGFQDLKEQMSVEMKGRFENDIFYASEIRLLEL